MYIFKNGLKCIARSKGRNVLIGIITLVIAVSACIGLSIRQAAESAKTDTLADLTVTATISYDRHSMMSNMKPPEGGDPSEGFEFDSDSFRDMMGEASSLTLDEYRKYAEAESVSDFYYTLEVYFNGTDKFVPVTTETDSSSSESDFQNPEDMQGEGRGPGKFMGNMMFGGMMGGMTDGDFKVVGYSSDESMIDFTSGNASVPEGKVFDEGTSSYDCIITEELATYNSLSVGDSITLVNPKSEDEPYTLNVVGIYTSSSSNEFSMSMFSASQDPANAIYMSAEALSLILDESEKVSVTVTNEETDKEYETALTENISATYIFSNVESYNRFEGEARELGLDEAYTISSSDVSAFETSLTPLNTLSDMAGWFLIVILAIGAIILIVLNIFNVRERKYEIGVLCAMGMKKYKVALQFICEILVVTMIAVLVGAGIGAVSAVPVTNALLENQVESQNSKQADLEEGFGREGNFGPGDGGFGGFGGNMPERPQEDFDLKGSKVLFENANNYITEIDSAMNLTVVLQMLGVGLLLTLAASMVSVLFVMRYDPLKILANRD